MSERLPKGFWKHVVPDDGSSDSYRRAYEFGVTHAEAKVRELEKWQARVKEESDRVHDRFFELLRVAEKLRGRVAYHHQWHQANTDYDEEIGQSPADAYVESHQYDDDLEALKKYEAFVVKITGREEPSNE